MRFENQKLFEKIKSENVRVHEKEGINYDLLHREVNNFFQNRLLKGDVSLIKTLVHSSKPTILDIGCGTGNLLLAFAKENFQTVGVDISPTLINQTREKLNKLTPPLSPRLIVKDIDKFLAKESNNFDVITFGSVLHHLPNYLSTLKRSLALLKKEGIVYILDEPLARRSIIEGFFSYRFLYRFDQWANRLRLFLSRVKPLNYAEYEYSDYHRRHGTFAHQKILSFLKSHSFKIICFREFSLRKTGLLSLIDTKILGTKNAFSLIAQRQSS